MNKMIDYIKIVGISLMCFFCSCITKSNNNYVQGKEFSIGIYIPVSGNLYGLQFLHYLQGIKCSYTNDFQIEYNNISTNSYLGFDSIEINQTKIQ